MLLLQAPPDFANLARQAAQFIMPEAILTLFACAALVLDVMLPRGRKRVVAWVSLVGIGFAFASLALTYFNIVAAAGLAKAFTAWSC